MLLWAREPEVVEAINARHENPLFLPGVPLAPAIRATGDLADLADCDALLVVAPAQHLRAVLGRAAGWRRRRWCSAPRGSRRGRGLLMHEVARRGAPGAPIAVLSGPTFAHEVAARPADRGDARLRRRRRSASGSATRIARPDFRPYLSDDVAGAEIGGAVKNVLAIACGVVEGAGLGQNARAALIARGFAEMTPLRAGQRRAGARRWRACPASATSSSPARRPARAISRSARASARARRPPSCCRSPDGRRGRLHRAGARARCRARRPSTCRSSPRSALARRAGGVDQVLDALLSRPSRAEGV